MSDRDFDDPEVEDEWCREQLFEVADYLERKGLVHGRIDEEPSFFVAPYVSLWGVCSSSQPGILAWWVIQGDLPGDYISAAHFKNPRAALHALGERWLEVADCMRRGEPHPTMQLGNPDSWPELAPMLESRAETLLGWAGDDELWDY